MTKTLAALTLSALPLLAAAPAAEAGGQVGISITLGLPVQVVAPLPVVVYPAPPVVYRPPQVVYYPPQYYYYPPQTVVYGQAYYGGHHHGHRDDRNRRGGDGWKRKYKDYD